MNFWDRMKYVMTGYVDPIEPEQKQGVPKVLPWQEGQPQYLRDNYFDYSEGAFGRNELVFACIMEIATSVPEAPLRVYDEDDQALEEHPLRLLIKQPNPFMTEFELWELTLIHLYIAGNAYWEKVRNGAGQVVELVPLRPDRVQVIPGNDFIEAYQYSLDGRQFRLDANDIIHFKFPNPLDDFLGMPPLRAGLKAISTDNEATDFAKVLLQNRAIPGVVITTQNQIDEATATRLTKRWKQKFSGNKRGEPAFLQEGMTVNPVGMNMQDLAFPDLRAISETRICSVFGVPPIIVGANTGLQRSTFSNYEEARRSFWQDTIGPLLRRLSNKVNNDLVNEWDQNGLEARFDNSNVTALQSIQNEKWTRANTGVLNGWVTVNEARAEVGLDPVPNGDMFIRGLSVVGIPSEPGEEPQLPPQPEPPDDEGPTQTAHPFTKKKDGYEVTALRLQDMEQVKTMNIKQLDLLRRAFGKINFAIESEAEFERLARREFEQERKEFMRLFRASSKQLDNSQKDEIITELERLEQGWSRRIKEAFEPTFEELITNSIQLGLEELGFPGIEFSLSSESAVNFIQTYNNKFAREMSATSRHTITQTITRGFTEGLSIREMTGEFTRVFEGWSQHRAVMVSRTETIRASNQGAKFAYNEAGIETMQWLASSDACPYCEELDGMTVGVFEEFVGLGGEVTPSDERRAEEVGGKPYTNNYETVDAPPLHPHCRCTIIPVIE